jgi:hypothetical protein
MAMDSSFPQFVLLPPELRCKIWRYALPRRTINFRLKMDMDAWNWAEDSDWWSNFFITEDFPHTGGRLPAVCFVNRESRGELTKLYKPFKIREGLLERISRDHSGEEASANLRKCDETLTPRFNPSTDVMKWSRIHRWSQNTQEKHSPLFLAAALSATHMDIEIDKSMTRPLTILTLAVIAPSGPLKTLQMSCGGPQYRLARVPTFTRRLQFQDEEHIGGILSDQGACFWPWFSGGWKPSRLQGLINDAQHNWLGEDHTRSSTENHSFPPDEHHDAEYAVYYVVRPEEFDITGREFGAIIGAEALHEMLDRNLRVDTTIPRAPWFPSTEPATGLQGSRKIYFHGFCSPNYGLPDSQES